MFQLAHDIHHGPFHYHKRHVYRGCWITTLLSIRGW